MNTKILAGIIAGIIILGGIFFLNQDKNQTVKDGGDTVVKDIPQQDESVVKPNQKERMPDPTPSTGEAPKSGENTYCTQDLKTCPDGSYVGRTAPKCEFSACPVGNLGVYKDYSESVLNEALQNGKKVVLFFHAKWCPECKVAHNAFTSKTDQIPSEVVLLKTDYDTEKALKTKYGVTYQHTFVQIDAQRNMITKWNGGDIDLLRKNLK